MLVFLSIVAMGCKGLAGLPWALALSKKGLNLRCRQQRELFIQEFLEVAHGWVALIKGK